MRKNGFTLIELLAVIVILAIIALIAVPIVINIINDSKKESINRSIELYIDHVQKMIAKEQMKDPTFNPSECEIKEDGNLECTIGTNKIDVEVEVKGKKPTKGIVIIEKNKIGLYNVELNGKKYYPTATLLEDAGTSGLSIGDKYEYEVKPGTKYKFYVLSIEGDKVNLIMDRNICEDGTPADKDNECNYAWHEGENNNNYGPDTAMTKLYQATKNWNIVPNIDLSGENAYYEENNSGTDYGYIGITTENGIATIKGKNGVPNTTIGTIEFPLKARLPREDEVTYTEVGCHVFSSDADYGTCPVWLVENLKYRNVSSYVGSGNTDKYNEINSNNGITNMIGYWTLSSYSDLSGSALSVSCNGSMHGHSTSDVNYDGVRAVITVSKSDLSN